jgi:competence protein ComGC
MTIVETIVVLLIANTLLLILICGLTASIVLHQRHFREILVELNAHLRRELDEQSP